MGTERGIIVASAAALLLLWIFLATRRFAPIDLAGDAIVLRYGTPLRVFAWLIVLAIPAPLVWLLLTATFPRLMDAWIIGFVLLDFLIVGGLLVLETERVRILLFNCGSKLEGVRVDQKSEWRAALHPASDEIIEMRRYPNPVLTRAQSQR